jgi:gamma-butyrobetaine dioxygenase
MRFIYENDGHFLESWKTILPLDMRLRSAVNWSPPFQGASYSRSALMSHGEANASVVDKAHSYYEALVAWESVLADPRKKFEFKLAEGDVVMFDNRRVLHARTSFRDWTEAERLSNGVELVSGEPTRWLKGCYIDGDAVWDRLTGLRRKLSPTD